MDFFQQTGKMGLGSRLRRLSERLTDEAHNVYELYGVDIKPKWFPVFFVLSQNQEMTITSIAEEIGHSHPSVSKIVREMSKNGIVQEKKGADDKRKNVVSLTAKGIELSEKIQPQYDDVNSTIEEMMSHTRHNLWNAIEEFEFLLDEKSFFKRVKSQKKKRESKDIKVIPYQSKYQQAFKELNEEWISQYFTMEDADRKVLATPEKSIIDKGGHIFIALYQEEVMGVCALLKMDDPDYEYELAKMAVSLKARGKGIGWLLGKAVADKAKSLGAKKLYLESNTSLQPAINLYIKLGFKKVFGRPTPYERCNIQMELEL